MPLVHRRPYVVLSWHTPMTEAANWTVFWYAVGMNMLTDAFCAATREAIIVQNNNASMLAIASSGREGKLCSISSSHLAESRRANVESLVATT